MSQVFVIEKPGASCRFLELKIVGESRALQFDTLRLTRHSL
jgi:hypothetical protein